MLTSVLKNKFALGCFFASVSIVSIGDASAESSPKDLQKSTVEDMYGKDDLGASSLFKGGFINFGYWENLPKEAGKITDSDRAKSSENMYNYIVSKLNIKSTDRVLEVGSGIGAGCVWTLRKFNPFQITCLDASLAQLNRAENRYRHILSGSREITFLRGIAEQLPFADNSMDKVYSIEAAQHFNSLDSFLKETYRVLKPDGKVVIVAFFSETPEAAKKLPEMLGTIKHGADKAIPLATVSATFKAAGFRDVQRESIGDKVWPGYDAWIRQTEYKDTWNTNWLKAYQQKLLDYVVFTAVKKPSR